MDIRNGRKIDFLTTELKNFQEIAEHIKPSSGEVPRLNSIEIYGEVIPYNGVVGGDHIIYVDFNKRYDMDQRIEEARYFNRPDIAQRLELNRHRSGVLLADVSGHNITDALLAAMLHQSFLTGVQYELKENGEITADLFEIINTRFFNSSSLKKFITLIYGEIHEDGTFKFINAGHPPPMVFSNKYDRLIDICFDRVLHFPPIGTLPSREDVDSRRNFSRLGYKKKYSINHLNLMGRGDILLLYTDGFSEHRNDQDQLFFPALLEKSLKALKNKSAKEIYFGLKEEFLHFAPPSDDASFVVIKKI